MTFAKKSRAAEPWRRIEHCVYFFLRWASPPPLLPSTSIGRTSLRLPKDSPTATMYIRQSKLRHLKAYKYSAVDHSLVSKYILKPFYTNFFIHVFPMSMASVPFFCSPSRALIPDGANAGRTS